MRRLILVITLFYSTFFLAQNEVSIADTVVVKRNYFKLQVDDFPVIKHSLDFGILKDNIAQLSVYNSFSQRNDVYFLQHGNYYRMSPKIVAENNLMGIKKDSFNPYGVSNLGSAVVMGVISVLFDKL